MALRWDSTSCVTPEPVDDNDFNGRELMIWGSVFVEIGEITEKNVDEWVFRIKFLEEIKQSVSRDPIPDLESLVRRWIGLRMNVSTETRRKWLNKRMKRMEDEIVEKIKAA
jgi:hypothetical protein